MRDSTKGVIAMVLACTIWGLSALYYRQIAHVPPLEVLSHRTIWSALLLLLFIGIKGRLHELRALLRDGRAMALVVLAAVMISINWFVFIYSVQVGKLAESSLGYYIFPLIAVVLGYLFLGERLSHRQWFAVALAFIAVSLLTYGLGVAPWISLILGGTFGLYGLIKKPLAAGPTITVLGEVVLLSPLAAIWIWGAHTQGWIGIVDRPGGFFGNGIDTFWLIFAGPMTAGPLVLMAYAMKRLSLASVGLVQYVNPTIQFLLATVIFMEPFTNWHLIAFALIWIGLAIYSIESWRNQDKT
ncbi:RarD protein [Amylibacter kogurei]|uniref:RarD protein n=1 Tax=Paramylibacter kogurei TaxID=1889778 RepID=A0A2G5K6M6_9RHOB|nr:EamA family transporter RarD [Amylibacter kogurei]PIB25085.1 RarD protein [Amylibacter kogurei]